MASTRTEPHKALNAGTHQEVTAISSANSPNLEPRASALHCKFNAVSEFGVCNRIGQGYPAIFRQISI